MQEVINFIEQNRDLIISMLAGAGFIMLIQNIIPLITVVKNGKREVKKENTTEIKDETINNLALAYLKTSDVVSTIKELAEIVGKIGKDHTLDHKQVAKAMDSVVEVVGTMSDKFDNMTSLIQQLLDKLSDGIEAKLSDETKQALIADVSASVSLNVTGEIANMEDRISNLIIQKLQHITQETKKAEQDKGEKPPKTNEE